MFYITSSKNIELVERFLMDAGAALKTFRYFESRPVEVILNHLETCFVHDEKGQIVGYGHLEKEGIKNWLGMAVIDNEQGKGVGSLIINHLLTVALKNNHIPLHLAVDKKNIKALTLYQKRGFQIVEDLTEDIYLMQYL